jgi:RHS repeat-associated protein
VFLQLNAMAALTERKAVMVVRASRLVHHRQPLAALLGLVLVAALLPATDLPRRPHAFGTPAAVNGPGPVDRPLPQSARSNTAPAKATPVVPPGIRAAGPPACYGAVRCFGKSAGRIDYSYDLVGNRTSQTLRGTAGAGTTTYLYDAADELTKQTTKASGQTTAEGFDYDLMGDQTKAGADTFSYNLDHSLAKATVSGRTTSFGYDAAGLRLTATTGTGAQAITQRWSWDVNGTLPQIALDTVRNSAGQLLDKRGFAYGPDDQPLALLAPGAGAHPYTHDWLGGVADMLSPAGVPEQAYHYDPYGNPRLGDTLKAVAGTKAAGATGPTNPLRYTGEYQDNTTGNGNYYLRARNYSPSTGHFTSTDPTPSGGSAVSPYAYAGDNPLAFTDPTGTMREPDGGDSAAPAPAAPTGDQPDGPSAEDIAKAQQLEHKHARCDPGGRRADPDGGPRDQRHDQLPQGRHRRLRDDGDRQPALGEDLQGQEDRRSLVEGRQGPVQLLRRAQVGQGDPAGRRESRRSGQGRRGRGRESRGGAGGRREGTRRKAGEEGRRGG